MKLDDAIKDAQTAREEAGSEILIHGFLAPSNENSRSCFANVDSKRRMEDGKFQNRILWQKSNDIGRELYFVDTDLMRPRHWLLS